MGKVWSDEAIRHLSDWAVCPRCESQRLVGGVCENCGADMRGAEAVALAQASRGAIEALTQRETLLATIPVLAPAAPLPPAYAAPAAAVPSTVPAPAIAYDAPVTRSTSPVGVQSVLAVLGAALFAVAAIVFAFYNPALTTFASRTVTILIVSAIFLAGAWLLTRAKLQFSGETVGALGMVFVILDIWAFATGIDSTLDDWVLAAIGTLIVSGIMIGLASIRKLRTWLWSGLVGISVTPALLGFADAGPLALVLGYAGVMAAALIALELTKPLRRRFDSQLRFDRWTLTTLQISAALIAVGVLISRLDQLGEQKFFIAAAVLGAIAVISLISTRHGIAIVWSSVAGIALISAAATVGAALAPHDGTAPFFWPGIAATIALLALVAACIPRSGVESPVVHRPALIWSAWTTAALWSTVALAASIATIATATIVDPRAETWNAYSVLGVACLALASAGLGLLARGVRSTGATGMTSAGIAAGLWFGGWTLSTVVAWRIVEPVFQVAMAAGLAAALVILLTVVGPVRRLRLLYRVPLIVTAHLLLVQAATISWHGVVQNFFSNAYSPQSNDDLLIEIGGIAVVAIGIALAYTVAKPARAVHVVIGYSYALVLFVHALSLTVLEPIAIASLTAAGAALFAAAVTVIRHFGTAFWMSIVGVTVVPFITALAFVFGERSGWSALALAASLVLAISLVLVRRTLAFVATIGAGLIVPIMSVIVICLVPQLTDLSGSPIALPIVAAIVAVALPFTALIRTTLDARGYAWAKATQLAIESTSLLTGAIAVIIAIARDAAGFGTSFLVLAIVGIGAAATAQFARRRYGWIVAYISFTGALWSLLAMQHVNVLESYVLPPAIVGAIIGAFATIRGLRGRWFYITGLGVAASFAIGLLAGVGYGSDPLVPWRAIGITIGALVLILAGFVFSRFERSRPLVRTTIVVAIAAAVAPTLQGIRFGLGLDPVPVVTDEGRMGLALALAGVSAAIAIVAASLLPQVAVRWRYAPAAAYLAVAPIFAVRHNEFAATTMYVLMAAYLLLIVITAVAARRRDVTLPPVWFTFVIAWVLAVAGWTEHYLRVDPYSIPMGLALLVAGIIAMRAPESERRGTLTSWPNGYRGSWRLLSPGIILTVLASIIATATTPETWRAILVIAFALAAIFIGLRAKLISPFVIGIAVLPVEIIVVFAAQLGTAIDPSWWWITLATAGAMLLVVAVNYERRTAGGGVAARLRDLT
jgi:hypothetical protein